MRAPWSHWHVRVWLLLFNIVVRFLHMHLILVWIVFLVVDPLSGLLFVQNVCVCVPAASMYVFLLLCDFTIDSVSVCMLTCVCVCFEREREKRERERESWREREIDYCHITVVVIWELFQIHDHSHLLWFGSCSKFMTSLAFIMVKWLKSKCKFTWTGEHWSCHINAVFWVPCLCCACSTYWTRTGCLNWSHCLFFHCAETFLDCVSKEWISYLTNSCTYCSFRALRDFLIRLLHFLVDHSCHRRWTTYMCSRTIIFSSAFFSSRHTADSFLRLFFI